jgi:alpha-D-xyloside xylohydrolase
MAVAPSLEGGAALRVEVRRLGKAVHVAVTAGGADVKPWRVLLRGVAAVHQVTGCQALADPLGTLLTPEAGATTLSVRLG